ncbi:hypothetical protein [Polluticoccus soli]|uniref:hypothetical protein n=1 Tax=Polluticoccus soli TaxID=3034150 RepID=UPI0023E2C473|nr:hypothetical protein [Flavipsychrobacter sp. JY13-12]
MLDRERRYYNTRRRKLQKKYQYKFIVLVGRKIVGVYDTHAEAFADSRKTFETGAFLICDTSVPHRI